MTLPLTTEILRAAYDYLSATPPFSRWNLPDSEDIVFKVAKTPGLCAWHDDGDRRRRKVRLLIAVSQKRIRTTGALLETMAHEMVHVHQFTHMRKESEHGPAFQRLADKVCNLHGFDRGLF